jgi:hypothetical protein
MLKWIYNKRNRKYELILEMLPQTTPFECDSEKIVIVIACIDRPANFELNYYRCYAFNKTWTENDLKTAKFNITKLVRLLFKETLNNYDFNGLNDDCDLWKFCNDN